MIPEISSIPLQHLASGDVLSLQVYRFTGAKPGKKAYLQSNLHGAEIVGNSVIYQLIKFLESLDESQLTGEIWLVPVCNPISTNQRTHYFSTGRFNPTDGKDWNRIFWDYEKEGEDIQGFAATQLNLSSQEIAENYLKLILNRFQENSEKLKQSSYLPFNEVYRQRLQTLCLDADYLIDIHSSSNQAIDYLYGFRRREESAKAFLLNDMILLNEYDGDAFDEAFLKPWLALEDSLEQLEKTIIFDKESWTLELGSGMVMNPESVEKGILGIKNYLAAKGMLEITGFPLAETKNHAIAFHEKHLMKKYYAPIGGMIQNRVTPGKVVKTGEKLYEILTFNKQGKSPDLVKIYAEADGLIYDISTNQAVNEGEYVLSVM